MTNLSTREWASDQRTVAIVGIPTSFALVYVLYRFTPLELIHAFSAVMLGVTVAAFLLRETSSTRSPAREVIERVEDEDTTDIGEAIIDYLDLITDDLSRTALESLEERGETQVSFLAQDIAARRADVAPPEVDQSAIADVHEDLYSEHLDKLDDLGFVTFDRKRGVVELTEEGAEIATYASSDRENGERESVVADTSLSNVFEVLKNHRRRVVLEHLDSDETVSLDSLVDRVLSVEQGTTPGEASDEDRDHVYNSLLQLHLPHLADSGFVEFDRSTTRVRLTESGVTVAEYLRQDHTEIPSADLPGIDTTYDLLSNDRRQLVLSFLDRSDGSLSLTELSNRIAAEENGIAIESLSTKQRKRVYVGLYQTHIPELEAAGAVAFDPDEGMVRLRDTGDALLDVLSMAAERFDSTNI